MVDPRVLTHDYEDHRSLWVWDMTGIQETIKQHIVSVIRSTPLTGQVFDRVKYSSNWQTFKDQFAYVDPASGMQQIRGWWVTVPTLTEADTDGSSFEMHWHNYTYPIHAVMSYSDKGDTEPAFSDMIWAVYSVLHSQGTLGLGPGHEVSGSGVISGSIGVEVPVVDMRMFGSILCHHAEFRITVGVGEPISWVP